MNKAIIFASILASTLVGCVKTANIKPEPVALNPNEGQFVPVRAFFNRSTPVPRFYVSRLEAVEAALKKSGAFFDVGPYVDSPIILDIELNRGTTDTTVDTAGQILSAATLFLIPTKANNFNELKVSVYAFGKLLKTYEFKQEYTQVIGLHNYDEVASDKGNEFLSIESLVNQFVNALSKDRLIPKVKLDESGQPIPPEEAMPEPQANSSLNPTFWSYAPKFPTGLRPSGAG